MIVRHWMTTEVMTIRKNASIQEAMALMKQQSIRHLPVVDDDGKLIGWVTDADLRGVLIASMLEDLTLEDVMIRKPYTANPEMTLEEAAQVLLEKRIGGLPVLEDGRPIGIITVVDVLSSFISVMGLLSESSRLDVKISSPGGPLHEIARVIQQQSAEVISVCLIPSREGQEGVYSIRLKKCDLKPIITDLKKNGIEVIAMTE